jgi:hypothetical protein
MDLSPKPGARVPSQAQPKLRPVHFIREIAIGPGSPSCTRPEVQRDRKIVSGEEGVLKTSAVEGTTLILPGAIRVGAIERNKEGSPRH